MNDEEKMSEIKEINNELDNSNILRNILYIVAEIRDSQLRKERDRALADVERQERELKYRRANIESDYDYSQKILNDMRYM